MNKRLCCMFGILIISGSIFGADIRRLNLRRSTYTPGGEPAPVMILVPKKEIEKDNSVFEYIKFTVMCFFKRPPKTVEQAKKRCNDLAENAYKEEDLVKVAIGRDDMQRVLNSLKNS